MVNLFNFTEIIECGNFFPFFFRKAYFSISVIIRKIDQDELQFHEITFNLLRLQTVKKVLTYMMERFRKNSLLCTSNG